MAKDFPELRGRKASDGAPPLIAVATH
jgi:hypothetical protein